MPTLQFRGDDAAVMQALPDQLLHDLQQAGLADDFAIGQITTVTDTHLRGDPVTWMTIALAAAGAGGALSTLLGKEGVLVSLARVLEKYVDGRQVEVIIQTGKDKKIQVKGPVGEIKAILQQVQD